jgi:hypothetical protein
MIVSAHGRVHARGRSALYEVPESSASGFLDVEVDKPGTGIVAVNAHGVQVRDLLEEIQSKLASAQMAERGEQSGWSYVLPGRCARKRIDFRFGREGEGAPTISQGRGVGEVMQALSVQLRADCQKRGGAWVFSGDCSEEAAAMTAGWNTPGWVLDAVPSAAIPAVFVAPAE